MSLANYMILVSNPNSTNIDNKGIMITDNIMDSCGVGVTIVAPTVKIIIISN